MELILLGLPICVAGLAWYYYAIKAFSHSKPNQHWGILNPFWMFTPKYFNAEGNKFRLRALYTAGILGLHSLLVLIYLSSLP